MVKLTQSFEELKRVQVLVVGDLMLDQYTTGCIERISPEAPVPIFQVKANRTLPGGAGNVLLNLISLGAHVRMVGRIGMDETGDAVLQALAEEGADTQYVYREEKFITPLKNRFIADSQQVLRVDMERSAPLSLEIEEQIIAQIPQMFAGVEVVTLSDYGKGSLTNRVLEKIISYAKQKTIPVIVDPKGSDFTKYQGATILKPNLSEAYAAARLSKEASLETVAQAIRLTCVTDMLLITRSEQGMTLFDSSLRRFDFPVRSKDVKDVTGAGDTALAMVSVALGSQIEIESAIQLANIAAGIAIERVGCVRVTLSELEARL